MENVANRRPIDFLAGISPQYWSHVPMMVMDVHNLQLRDGINCLVCSNATEQQNQLMANDDYQNLAPVSKCRLVGTIVYADRRRDGSMVYVLDDGTGMIDCVQWSTVDSQDIYYLPCLDSGENERHKSFVVGDFVRVFGKIDCLASIGDKKINGQHQIIREIQASIIETVKDVASEARHWQQCMAKTPKSIQSWLDQLGPEIQSQVDQRVNLPAADDTLGLWRVFGPSCRCEVDYKDVLLYCHCQATPISLDTSLRFRDALLHHLVEAQKNNRKMLVFKYKVIKADRILQEIASRDVEGKGSKAIAVDRLFLETFRALRKDGILYLINSDTDEYLLISREKVLEPFVRAQMKRKDVRTARNFLSMDGAPPYISRIHTERLQLIKRSLWDHSK
jgi:hypothetical protein